MPENSTAVGPPLGIAEVYITEDMVRKKLSTVRQDKAGGADDLLPRLLAGIQNEISYPLGTKYAGIVSAVVSIYASVIQGSAIGPTSYIVTAADLHPVFAAHRIVKFADDTYLVVPGKNSHLCEVEIDHLRA